MQLGVRTRCLPTPISSSPYPRSRVPFPFTLCRPHWPASDWTTSVRTRLGFELERSGATAARPQSTLTRSEPSWRRLPRTPTTGRPLGLTASARWAARRRTAPRFLGEELLAGIAVSQSRLTPELIMAGSLTCGPMFFRSQDRWTRPRWTKTKGSVRNAQELRAKNQVPHSRRSLPTSATVPQSSVGDVVWIETHEGFTFQIPNEQRDPQHDE